jgi:Protein of unknown function (DUF2752)
MELPLNAAWVAPAPMPSGSDKPWLRVRARRGATPLGAILGALAMAVLALTRLFDPTHLGFTVCVLKATTGVPCPTCGGTRALHQLAHFDLAGAWTLNPLVTLGVFALLPWALADAWLMRTGRALDLQADTRGARLCAVGAAVALLANWIYLLSAGR